MCCHNGHTFTQRSHLCNVLLEEKHSTRRVKSGQREFERGTNRSEGAPDVVRGESSPEPERKDPQARAERDRAVVELVRRVRRLKRLNAS